MKALILAGGRGSNLFPFTATRPKTMINVAGKFVLERTIELLKESGINVINIVVGHKKEKIINYFESSNHANLNLHYIEQKRSTGIGNAIFQARDRFDPGEYFILIYGDVLTAANIFSHTLQSFGSKKSPVASICLTQSSGMFGNVYLDDEMKITKIIEKPKKPGLGNYVLSGVYILPASFFNLLKSCNKNMEKAFRKLIVKGNLSASIWEEDWIDIAYPWDILSANRIIMDSWRQATIAESVNLNGDVKINGPVFIDENVEIRSGTILEGPCYIGKGSFIGNNVLVRKYTSISANSVIGYGVELKNSILFEKANVGRLSFIGDSVLGYNIYFGSGTMTINHTNNRKSVKTKINGKNIDSHCKKLGTFAGDNVTIGTSNSLLAGTIIPSSKVIPHNHSYPK
tara:strand:- start:2177 stop:3379 length:1203 start_codon:yes stop_codon:yes gene_type:complete